VKEPHPKSVGINTLCVHAGEGIDEGTGALRRPIHMANSYELPTDIEKLIEVFSWDHLDKFQYTREHSATPRHLEERLAALEGSEDCIVTASGMGAVSAVLFTLLNGGDHIVASEVCYTGTQKLLSVHMPRFGVDVSPEGNYLTEDSTLEYFKEEHFLPKVTDRKQLDTWKSTGRKSIAENASETVNRILSQHQPRQLDPKLAEELGPMSRR